MYSHYHKWLQISVILDSFCAMMLDFLRVLITLSEFICANYWLTVFSLPYLSQKRAGILAFSCHDQCRRFSHVFTIYMGVHTDTFKISIQSPKTDSKGCTNEHHTFRDEWIGLCKHYELKSSECWTPLKVRNLVLSLVDIKIKMRETGGGKKRSAHIVTVLSIPSSPSKWKKLFAKTSKLH